MSWLTEYVRPKFRTLLGKRDVPDNLWVQCEACTQMVFGNDLEKNLRVCPHCGHHMAIDALSRLAAMFDEAKFTRLDLPKVPTDPLGFRDEKRYADRLRENRGKTHLDDALVVATGTIAGIETVAAAMEFRFMGGSMGAAVGEGLLLAARQAVQLAAPLVIFTASGGARMQEGMISLMQMPRTTIAVQMVREAGLPYVVVLTNPTTGGVTASFAMLGDIHIAEPGATIGFAGARVIEQTVRETLPEGFQRSEYLLDHGIVDMVVPRTELAATLGRILGLLHRAEPPASVEQPAEAEALPVKEPAPAS
jgi:acetyl-CoA carboxylase carboxyl transferase subunit beta